MMDKAVDEWWIRLSGFLVTTIICLQVTHARQEFLAGNHKLNRFVFDTDTDKIYVGAINKIFILNSNFETLANVTTGQKLDNNKCTVLGEEREETCERSNAELSLMDNHNKVLVLDKSSNSLLTCGSVFQGTCEKRELDTGQETATFYSYVSHYVLAPATSDDDYETVSFVAPGPQCDGGRTVGTQDVLYTALSLFYVDGRQLNVFTFLSSHTLSTASYLEYAYEDVFGDQGTYTYFMEIDRYGSRNIARSGFSHDGFSYFLFLSQFREDGEVTSKIARVCQSDCTFNSYVEIPIQCESSGRQYIQIQTAKLVQPGVGLATQLRIAADDDILVAIFHDGASVSERDTAVCVFTMEYIRSMFTQNVQACQNGEYDTVGADFKDTFNNKRCSQTGAEVSDDYCDTDDTNSPLSGQSAATASAILTIQDTFVTSVVVDVVDKYTVAFFGTSEGVLKKAELLNGRNIYGDDDVIEQGAAIKPDMVLTDGGLHIIIMTSNKLYKVPTSNCDEARTCSECKQLADPYCGWCSLEIKCSRREECINAQQQNRWTSYEGWCINLAVVNPQRASIERGITMVTANINGLPDLTPGNTYDCVFGDDVRRGDKSATRVICPTPLLNITELPVINGNLVDHRKVNFSVRSSETGLNFLQASTQFTFYSCSVHASCSSCASAAWDCKWCVHENSCRNEFSTCGKGSHVTEESGCPRITHRSEILVPNGVPMEIRIEAVNLPVPLQDQEGYVCVVHLGEPARTVAASRQNNGELIVCAKHSYEYEHRVEKEEPSVAVYWNGDFVVETQDALNVEVYKCDVMGQDCSECLSLNESSSGGTTYSKYNCSFCESQGMCIYRNACDSAPPSECPPPEILAISPLSSPIEGGTRITIEGTNLGSRREQVEGAVTVGRQSCRVESYRVAREIICTVQAVDSVKSVVITVSIHSSTQSYGPQFHYKDPRVSAVTPELGPKSGGTPVTIDGSHLDTGKKITVLIGGVTCAVNSITDNRITCLTGRVASPISGQLIKLRFDTANRDVASMRYRYTNDPKIADVAPLATFLSGGRILTVTGTDLNVVQNPRMFVEIDSGRYISNCSIVSTEELKCPTPALSETNDRGDPLDTESRRKKRQDSSDDLYPLGFIFDGVLNPLQNSSSDPYRIAVHPDPVFTPFKNGKKTYAVDSDSSLEIEGENISLAAKVDEISVTIGDAVCVVKTISLDRLYCTPPRLRDGDAAARGRQLVVVRVGNVEQELGSLLYQFKKSTRTDIWILVVAVVGGVLLSVIIIISIIYKRKKTQADRQYKKLKMQLDTLESNVRNECKQAFAELQTEVSDFTSDISVIGIPYWDYKTYTFKVLFPSHADHPVLHNSPDYKTNKFGSYDQGLHQFSQLLNSKQFMLIFIRTLEQQKNFSIRDKAVVASLLMIVLQDKMEYATEILKSLLEELIDRSVEKKHPKLMLRRTESVVEKLLTNWLSIAMYGYVKRQSGKPLFMLYQAIKRQTEKGPVDAISSEARYSLSEDRLLREKIEPKTLLINLVQDGQKEPVTCKCLDCDTITQAKQKALDAVYLNMPFSNRPSVHDVDLEWRSGKSGHLPLQDEDVTTEVLHGWKKINTLAHYHVPDGAVMALVRKRHKTEGVRHVHGRIQITSGSGLSGIQPILTMEEGQKVWHLVKHDDGIYISRSQKVISEIFLTRLLSTKGTLQQYIDDLFMTILTVDNSIPPAIKWLFDLLDTSAKKHNILDPDVVHTWKSNSLPLRFWVNIIKNPDFVFDINKSHICDSCLSVIAQTFMDACSTTDHKLGKDSPSNKLLFAKDIPRYRGWVTNFYRGIQDMAPVSDADINEIMTEMSLNFLLQHYTADFNVSIALKELFKYAHQYNFELLENLDEDPSARKLHLANMFEQVTAALDGGTMFRN